MTARERALIDVIESLPRHEKGLDHLPIVGVLRGAQRLHDALLDNASEAIAKDDLLHLLTHPESVELWAQRDSRTGVDWHDTLVQYVAYPGSPLRRLVA